MAQDSLVTNKAGVPVLPKAGDIALGADATPYLNYLGNMFNNTVNNSLSLGAQNLYFRYYLADDMAVRVNLQLNNTTSENNLYVADEAARYSNPLSQAQLIDQQIIKNRGANILIGAQKMRGYGRLRGFYGAQLGYGFASTKEEYSYGNNITSSNQTPLTSDFGTNVSGAKLSADGHRVLEYKSGTAHSVFVGALCGVEYYFLPKACIGGEVSLMYYYTSTGQSSSVSEHFDGNSAVNSDKAISPGGSNSGVVTSRPSTYQSTASTTPAVYGGLYLMFHF